jgi:dihydrofolate synthase/folylpolyglutamate synthase
VSAITSISLDHREFLGGTLAAIAGEKAGILKAGVPAVSGTQTPVVAGVLAAEAARIGTQLACRGRDWQIRPRPGGLLFEDARGSLALPAPLLPGEHQWDNAGIAIAALRTAFAPPAAAYAQGLLGVNWPARLQRLHGALAATLPAGCELWLDGGHNPGAGVALARHLAALDGPTHLIIGMKQGKDLDEFLRPLLPLAASLWAVAEPGQHLACSPAAIVAASGGLARPGPTVAAALAAIAARVAPPARVLICGSLYLAGEVLKADGTPVI